MKRDKMVPRVWMLMTMMLSLLLRPALAQVSLPPVEELRALTDFEITNGNLALNGQNLGSWKVGFNPQGNWTGGNPCHGYKGVRCWSSGNVRILRLPLSGLGGTISPALGNLTRLTRLSLGENRLSGDIAHSLAPLVNMKRLRLEGNMLTGSVPALVRNMVALEELSLARNVLQGQLPPGVFSNLTLLQIVDISNNSLSGTIPDDLVRSPSLQTLLLNGNNFTGIVPESLASSTSLSLSRVDLSRNSLNGSLPAVWKTPNLTYLDLSRNNLSGPIPLQLLNLTTLKMLNLSQNNFVGNVSIALSTEFGCSAFNDNIGLIMEDPNCVTNASRNPPPASQASDPSQPENPRPEFAPNDHHKKERGLSTLAIVALTAGDICLLLLSAAGFALFWIWWKKKESSKVGAGITDSDNSKHSSTSASLIGKGDDKDIATNSGGLARSSFAAKPALRPALKSVVGMIPDPDNESEYMTADMSVDDSLNYSIDEFGTDLVILDSTLSLEFDDLLRANAVVLGAGSFGGVYMAVLEDGQMVAIKRLEEHALLNEKAFGSQCTHLAEVLHPNLLQMRAYCWSPQEKLLIFDYMANGSVHFNLHAKIAPKLQENGMDWSMRLKIAVGTARALAHLHDNDMVHGNIKATNVLLDEHFEPRVSDFGLDLLLETPLQHGQASAGYLAPELESNAHVTSQDSDVYSFGVFLLELVTGLEPARKNDGTDLPTWVQEMTSTNRTVEVYDPALVCMPALPAQDVLEFLELAQACVCEDASARPSITIVLRTLESIVPGSTAPRSYVPDDTPAGSHDFDRPYY